MPTEWTLDAVIYIKKHDYLKHQQKVSKYIWREVGSSGCADWLSMGAGGVEFSELDMFKFFCATPKSFKFWDSFIART
jgi:hypothetical protein